MLKIEAALGDNIKKTPKGWVCKCPTHNDSDFAMHIQQKADGSIIAHCFGCGANGLDLYRSLGLDLSELFGGNNTPYRPPQYIIDQYEEDKYFLAVYEQSVKSGIKPTYKDNRRKRLAEARMKGIREKYNI